MKNLVLLVLIISLLHFCDNNREFADNSIKLPPGDSSIDWLMYKTPTDAGFDEEKLKEVQDYFNESDLASLFIVYKGKVLLALGDYQRRYSCHSIRKSLLNSVYGIYYDKQMINIETNINELNINDVHQLTSREKQATIKHLLQSRSGVYHPAVYETLSMKKSKPARGSYEPGEHWYYNNWDFNVLNSAFRQLTSKNALQVFEKEVAAAIDFEDFRSIDSHYFMDSSVSLHPASSYKLSARDLARFGQLYLQNGTWNGKQILSHKWIVESTRSYSKTNTIRGGYGYLWWIPEVADSIHCFAACGVGTQVLLVVKELELIIVQRVNTYVGEKAPFDMNFYRKIIGAKTSSANLNSEFIKLPEKNDTNFVVQNRENYVGDYKYTDGVYSVKNYRQGLLIIYPGGLKSRLIPITNNRFKVEDIGEIIELENDDHLEIGQLVLIGVTK